FKTPLALGIVLVTLSQFLLTPVAAEQGTQGTIPMTGAERPEFRPLQDAFLRLMTKQGIPGGALSVRFRGRLLFSRGYGYADVEAGMPWQGNTLCRIASATKPITAASVLLLVQEGKLKLSDKAFAILGYEPFLKPGASVDRRLHGITVDQLLHHTGGWDRHTYEPMWHARSIADEMGVPAPATSRDMVRYMMGRPLDMNPGEKYAYSNFGYMVLGELVTKLSGTTYERYVQAMLSRMGISGMRIGASLMKGRAANEARYYTPTPNVVASVFAENGFAPVPYQYGGSTYEAMAAHGGWIATADQLTQFACELANPTRRPVLNATSLAAMVARPARETGLGYYGAGWSVTNGPAGITVGHGGYVVGANSYFSLRCDGVAFSFLMNGGDSKAGEEAANVLHGVLDAMRVGDTMPAATAGR
ncbi:MAG TPA: serine hydrolase domain-containing protein, partial [Armatimonadota bacterium]|nr:serine hydrolase domain-containing protein [Armatimonadota bacterium]